MTNVESHERSNNYRLARLCAVVKQDGRRSPLFFGWNEADIPLMVVDEDYFTQEAKETYEVSSMLRQKVRELIPRGRIEVVQYRKTGKPKDAQDEPGGRKTQDLLVYNVVDDKGKKKNIYVRELDLLRAIVENRSVWQEIGETVLTTNVEPTKPMYAIFIPSPSGDRTYAMMFKSRMEDESNQFNMKLFLTDTIRSLLALDQNQAFDNQKGYLRAVNRHFGEGSRQGGLAHGFIKHVLGMYVNIPEHELEDIRKISRDGDIVTQLELIGEFLFTKPLERNITQTPTDEMQEYFDKIEAVLKDVLRTF